MSQVLCFIRVVSSLDMTSRQWGWEMAWLTLVGSMVEERGYFDTVWSCLGLKIWYIDLMVMVWVRWGKLLVSVGVGKLEVLARPRCWSWERDCKFKEEPVWVSCKGKFKWVVLWSRVCKQSWKKGAEGSKSPKEDATMVGGPPETTMR